MANAGERPSATPASLFEPDGDRTFVPTAASAGPWRPEVLHGGAVSALLAGLLEHPDEVVVRVLIDLLGPVPSSRLTAEVTPSEGGRRVKRQSVVLRAADQPVARAFALRMRRGEVDLPATATDNPVVFDPDRVPDLSRPNRYASSQVGWPSFDSLAMATRWETGPSQGEGRLRLWMNLLIPVVPDRPVSAIENVAAAADFGTGGTGRRLDFQKWSFMNADLVISLSRPPVGDWVGIDCDGLVGRTGTGQSVTTLHDEDGPLGRSSQSILVEPR